MSNLAAFALFFTSFSSPTSGLRRLMSPSERTVHPGYLSYPGYGLRPPSTALRSTDSTEKLFNMPAAQSESMLQSKQSCVSLISHGSIFTTKVKVGPNHSFDVVVDTGSDMLIVPSCACDKIGQCPSINLTKNCYTSDETTYEKLIEKNIDVMGIQFGSGAVDVVKANDTVTVGDLSADMKGHVFLIVKEQLQGMGGFDFEGILGLGLPQGNNPHGESAEEEDHEEHGFLEHAGIGKFSICFGEKDGVLRLGAEFSHEIHSIGHYHWGLGVTQIDVGAESLDVCKTKKQGQDTACGAIVDSGTTLITGSAEHLGKLFEKICAKWPNWKNQTSSEGESEDSGGLEVLELQGSARLSKDHLKQCFTYLQKCEGLDQLPDISFHVSGSPGETEKLKLSSQHYIIKGEQPTVKKIKKTILGIPFEVDVPTGKTEEICAPGFDVEEYNTEKNGPVWILGMPLFYSYQVGFDINAKPTPAISFTKGGCSSCQGQFAAINSRVVVPRSIGTPVQKKIDTSLPL